MHNESTAPTISRLQKTIFTLFNYGNESYKNVSYYYLITRSKSKLGPRRQRVTDLNDSSFTQLNP